MKIKVPDNPAVFGNFPRVRVFWPSTVDINLGSGIYGSNCSSPFYQKAEFSLRLLDSSGNSKAGQLFQPCGAGPFKSCNALIQDRNDPRTMLASPTTPITLNHSMTYTLQARYSDNLLGYYGYSPYICEPYPTSGSHFTWKVFNQTITLTK